jgi:hypothetical protein
VTVEFEREVVYRRFLPPNTTELKDEAVAAADLVKQQIIQRKLQRLLQDTTDLRGTSYEPPHTPLHRRLPAGQRSVLARPPNWCTPGQPGVWRQPVERHLAAQQRPGAERLRRPGPEGPHLAFTGTSALERFSNQLESRMLAQLLDNISNGNTGSMSTDAFLIDVIDDSGA